MHPQRGDVFGRAINPCCAPSRSEEKRKPRPASARSRHSLATIEAAEMAGSIPSPLLQSPAPASAIRRTARPGSCCRSINTSHAGAPSASGQAGDPPTARVMRSSSPGRYSPGSIFSGSTTATAQQQLARTA